MIIPVSPLGLLLGLAGERRLQTAQSKITFRVDRASCAGGSVDSHHHTFGHCALLIWNDSCRCSSLSGLSIQANWSTPRAPTLRAKYGIYGIWGPCRRPGRTKARHSISRGAAACWPRVTGIGNEDGVWTAVNHPF